MSNVLNALQNSLLIGRVTFGQEMEAKALSVHMPTAVFWGELSPWIGKSVPGKTREEAFQRLNKELAEFFEELGSFVALPKAMLRNESGVIVLNHEHQGFPKLEKLLGEGLERVFSE